MRRDDVAHIIAIALGFPRPMEHVLIERDFGEPTTFDDFVGAGHEEPGCLERYRVIPQGSYVAVDGLRMICHTLAPDAESVRTVSRLHDVPHSRIWTADLHAEEPLPERLGPAASAAYGAG